MMSQQGPQNSKSSVQSHSLSPEEFDFIIHNRTAPLLALLAAIDEKRLIASLTKLNLTEKSNSKDSNNSMHLS